MAAKMSDFDRMRPFNDQKSSETVRNVRRSGMFGNSERSGTLEGLKRLQN
jgi:hypothetical protein